MQIPVFALTSFLHDRERIEASSRRFLDGIRACTDLALVEENDWNRWNEAPLRLLYVRTGGTESEFLRRYPDLTGPYYLLTSGTSNSLAASMEILSFLRERGDEAEIIHGSDRYIACRLERLRHVAEARTSLRDRRYGMIGEPSDWLIASRPQPEALRAKLGVELVGIPMQELLGEVGGGYPARVRARLAAPCDEAALEGALQIYGALLRLVERHSLSGLTLRCFDLLGPLRNTGCLALALLNADGIVGCCEGDTPAMISMAVAQALTGSPGFQANPSQIDVERNSISFAHCTLPLDMPERYAFDSHFESGLGVAIRGELPLGPATVFKCSGDLSRYFASDARLEANAASPMRCRTQVELLLEEDVRYFLRESIGNHHIILRGHRTRLIGEFFRSLR